MWRWLIPLMALSGTLLQTWTSLRELGQTRREALNWSLTEDELVGELPAWRQVARRRRKRELVEMRGRELDREIRHVNQVFFAWVLLDFAAAAALAQAIF